MWKWNVMHAPSAKTSPHSVSSFGIICEKLKEKVLLFTILNT